MPKNKSKAKKMIAPVICAVIIFALIAVYSCIWIYAAHQINIALVVFIGIIFLALAGVLVFVLVERIKEIRSGEEDDLSKY